MTTVVHKYGGTSVGSVERIQAVADRVLASHRAGERLLVVVSAMGETTDHLMELARQISARPDQRELDMLLTAGERISMALLALTLRERGAHAISFTGSQSGIVTDTRHGRARITEIRPHRLHEALDGGAIVIVAGFQGVSRQREVTTLGRGGSDTTAVALAAELDARCIIYTDVDGIYTADPRIVTSARRLPRIDSHTLATMAHLGSHVLHPRSVDLAAKFAVALEVRSSFNQEEGTMVVHDAPLEGPRVLTVALEKHATVVDLSGTECEDSALQAVLSVFSGLDVTLNLLQAEMAGGTVRLTWILKAADAQRFEEAWATVTRPPGSWRLELIRSRSLVSLVGHELSEDADVALDATRTLSRAGITVYSIRITSSSVSLVVDEEQAEKSVRCLHEYFVEKIQDSAGTPAQS